MMGLDTGSQGTPRHAAPSRLESGFEGVRMVIYGLFTADRSIESWGRLPDGRALDRVVRRDRSFVRANIRIAGDRQLGAARTAERIAQLRARRGRPPSRPFPT